MALPAIIRLIGFARVRVEGLNELKEFFQNIPDKSYSDVKKAYQASLDNIQRKVKSNLGGTPMRSRTGKLRDSIKTDLKGSTIKTLVGEVYSREPYARIHERGGTVRAKRAYSWLRGGPYLNIPTKYNQDSRGVTRMNAYQVFSSKGRVMRGPEGFGVYLGSRMMFVLSKSVRIKARLGVAKATEQEIPTLLSNLKSMLLEDK